MWQTYVVGGALGIGLVCSLLAGITASEGADGQHSNYRRAWFVALSSVPASVCAGWLVLGLWADRAPFAPPWAPILSMLAAVAIACILSVGVAAKLWPARYDRIPRFWLKILRRWKLARA